MFEMGPEPTQMGASPLISFGNTSPLTALVGEQPLPQRTPVRETPVPQATFLPEAKPPFYKDRRVQIAAGLLVVALVVLLIVVLS